MRHVFSLAVSVAALIAVCSSFGRAEIASNEDDAPNEPPRNLTRVVHNLAAHLKAEADSETPSAPDEERLSFEFLKTFAARIRGKSVTGAVEETATKAQALSRSASLSKSAKAAEANPAPQFTKQEIEAGTKAMADVPLTKWGKFLMGLKILAGAGFAWAVAASVYAMGSAYTIRLLQDKGTRAHTFLLLAVVAGADSFFVSFEAVDDRRAFVQMEFMMADDV
ncbi:unnamed protein product [Hyaloperonospora brassicae]|uniref:RxLR effector candidate protein n=1 Tax=Hyaloperonospora brassicae TaxID=162125 RepID=A0AAV0U2E2_HYABA|nr:unnamed protein product [Hyaloperonospora brassicae]